MAGAMRKMAVYLGLVEDDERSEHDYFDDDYDAGETAVVRHPAADRARMSAARGFERADERGSAVRYTSSAAPRPVPDAPTEPYRITSLHPRTYNEARTIGEHFRDGTPVIMNLTEMDDADAKRLVDFAAGLIFGLRGSIERVTNKVFLLTPANVEITAEDKSRMAESGFFNQS